MNQALPRKLTDAAALFLKLGMTVFGRPAAHIAMMRWLFPCIILLAGCSTPVEPASVPTREQVSAPALASTLEPTPAGRLVVSVLYPKENSEVEMGQPVKFIAQVTTAQGNAVSDAKVTLTLRDPAGDVIAAMSDVPGNEGIYRTDFWTAPHRTLEGKWSVAIEATTDGARGNGSGSFGVKNSMSEVLLSKYGFWLDAPTLRGIVPQLVAERGDAHNGLIRWGGTIPAQHILPENWVEIHWREGNYGLENPEAVRRFMLEELGDLGFIPIRNIGPFQPIRFKHWRAWQVTAQGEFGYDQMEWVVFLAPEVNETFAIATTVVLPPVGVNPHALLRDSFAVFPDVHAAGVAPEPLSKLLPGPELQSPSLAARFQGPGQPIVLRWKPIKELAKDEYYEIAVDYNVGEANPTIKLAARETHIALPEKLYRTPNCQVFNWQVTLMRQTGVDGDGQPKGEAISYSSLYWYLFWSYPPGQTPFNVGCPNLQY